MDTGNLFAKAGQLDLVSHAYDLTVIAGSGLQRLISGDFLTDPPYTYPIEWHQKGDGYLVKIYWTEFYDGVPDTIRFRGVIDTRDTSVAGVDAWLTGCGTASGE